MIWYRDGFIWVPAPAALAEQRQGLEMGALVVVVDGTDAVPSVRDSLEFHLLVDGQRLGPLHAEVVSVDGQEVALHLAEETQGQILGCLGVPDGAAAGVPAASQEAQRQDGEASPATPASPGSSPDEAVEGKIVGKLAGKLALGMVTHIFDDMPGARPPATTTLVRLLGYLDGSKATGVLTVEGLGYVKRISFKAGAVVNVTVTPCKEDEQLGQLLLGAHWITPHKLADVLRWARADKIPIGSAMLQSGVLDDARLERALSHQTYRRLRDVFEWEGARFTFDPGELPSCGAAPMSISRLLHEVSLDVFRMARLGELDHLISAYVERFPRLEGDPTYIKRLVSDSKLLRACERVFRGDRTLRQAMTALVADRPKTVRLVLYLIAARGLKLHVEPQDVAEAKLPQVARERVRAIGVQDAFQRLGVTYWAHASEIEQARRVRLAYYREGSAYHRVDSRAAATICQLMEEAVLLVATPQARRKYRERLLGPERMAFFARLLAEDLDFLRIDHREPEIKRGEEVLAELAS